MVIEGVLGEHLRTGRIQDGAHRQLLGTAGSWLKFLFSSTATDPASRERWGANRVPDRLWGPGTLG